MSARQCIDDCTACHIACVETAIHCLAQGGAHAGRDRVRLLWDCAEACAFAAGLLSRGSAFHVLSCELCRAVCRACAEDCGNLAHDPIIARCADACARCAESCMDMTTR